MIELNVGDRVRFIKDYRSLNNDTLLGPYNTTAVVRKVDAAKGRKYALSLSNGKEIDLLKISAHHYLRKI